MGRVTISRAIRSTLLPMVFGGLLLTMVGMAHAFSTAPGYLAKRYATGFASSQANHWGPIGIAFDRSDNLYVVDRADGDIYRFKPGGGVASSRTRLTPRPIGRHLTGMAIS